MKLQRRLAPPPRLTLSEWADRFRRLSPESSAEPGRWNTARAAYQRGMMDVMTDPRVERVVFMTSARVGKTQALNNLVGFHIHQDPAPMLLVLPTEQRAEEWADDEFDPMVRDTPALRAILGDRKSRNAKQRRTHRQFPGGRLYMVGANAPSGLAAKTVRIVLADEVDRFPPSAGDEGDPITLAEKRAATIWNRKIVLSSTPTTAGSSRIEAAYAESDRRRFWVPCPHCGHAQVLTWGQVRWDEDAPETARYHCDDCGAGWTDAERWAAIRDAEANGGGWRAEGEFRGVAGFHISEIYSSFRRLSETVRDFLAAKDSPERLRVWVNTALGEVWQDRGEAPNWERLLERRVDMPRGVVPAWAAALTMGVDVQKTRLEAYVWAWGEGYTSALVDRLFIEGDPTQAPVWDALLAEINRPWPREGGGDVQILRAGVDTGGHATAQVYGHLRRLREPRILPLKGADRLGMSSPVIGPTLVDVTERGRRLKQGLRLWTVAVSTFKSELYRRLWLTRTGEDYPPGWVHLPEWADAEILQQLVSEELRTVKAKTGFVRQEWAKLRERNEALDCTVYARAALWVAGSDRGGDRFWSRLAGQAERKRSAAPAPEPVETPAPSPVAPKPARPGRSRFWKAPSAGRFSARF